MRQLTDKKLLAMTPSELADLLNRAVRLRQFKIFFESLNIVCEKEIASVLVNLHLLKPKRYVTEAIEPDSYLAAIAQFYPTIAPIIRQAYDNGILTTNAQQNTMLDVISLIYVASIFPKCAFYTNNPQKLFVIRNQKSLEFWQWYRAHLPHDIKFASFEGFGFPLEFILPSIVISSPNDLQFYKVFCRELKAKNAEAYEYYKIESKICKKMIERLKQKEAGITPEPQEVSAESVKNNILILDILR